MTPKDSSAIADPADNHAVLKYRTVWVSDLHLGTRGCQAVAFLDFLKHMECEHLYLVGDIIDFWHLRNGLFWPQEHNNVIQKLLRCAKQGTRVTYIPGNHDEAVRSYNGLSFGGISVANEPIHTTVTSQRFLIVHGDQFDAFMHYAKWLAYIGDTAYTFLLAVNSVFNYARRKLGFSYWSLSAYLKHKVKNAMEYISSYEKFIAEEARRHHVDGVICGHIHQTDIRNIGSILYCNDGDWVESCTALVEDYQGQLSLIHWMKDRNALLEKASATMTMKLQPSV